MKAALAGGLLGAALFLAVFGAAMVRPTNLGWTMRHDLQTYVLAWTHFRHEPWQWPAGAHRRHRVSGGHVESSCSTTS